MEIKNNKSYFIDCVKNDFVVIKLTDCDVSVSTSKGQISTENIGRFLIVSPLDNFIGEAEIFINSNVYKISVLDLPSRKYENISKRSAIELLELKEKTNIDDVIKHLFDDKIKSLDELKSSFNNQELDQYIVLNRFKTYIDKNNGTYHFQDYKPYSVKNGIDWGEECPPYDTRSWKYSFNAMFFIDDLIDKGEFDYALEIMKSWVNFNIELGSKNNYAWYDMGVAIRAPKLAFIFKYAMINDLLSNKEIINFIIAIQAHLTDLCDENKLALHSNHGLYQLSGILGVVNILPELKDSMKIEQFATKLFCEVAHKDINNEGVHIEHSPAYHIFMLEMISSLIKSTWLKDESLTAKLQLMEEAATYIFHPDQKYVRFGDTSNRIARHVLPNALYEYNYIKEMRPESDCKVFPESGYAYFYNGLRTEGNDASLLAFSAAFHKRTHKHADDFTFEWSDFGRKLLIDAGMFGYQRDAIEREYVQSTRAHNCVEIDGQDYSRYNLDIFGSAITAWSDQSDIKLVEANLYRKRFFQTHHRRIIIYKPKQWLLVIDNLKSKTSHDFTQWFHFDPALKLEQILNNSYVDIDSDKRLWINSLDENSKVTHINSQFEPNLQGWTSIEPYKLTANDALGFKAESKKEHTFATLFSFGSKTSEPKLNTFKCVSNGKYIRAKWQTPQGETQDIIYRISSNNRELTSNSLPVEVTVREDA